MLANGERGEARVHLGELHPGTDVFVVLVPPLVLLCVGCQVGIHNADARVVQLEADRHPSFVTLGKGPLQLLKPSDCHLFCVFKWALRSYCLYLTDKNTNPQAK